MDQTAHPGSQHFALHELAGGVFAAIAENGGFAICNSGLVDLGGQILVFDTFLTPQAAYDLRCFAIDYYGHAPTIVINSHYHNDHIWGNQVFAADALIYSSIRTRELIATEGKEELDWYSSNSFERFEALKTKFQKTTDPQQQQDLLLWMGEYGGVVEALPSLKVIYPTVAFNRTLEFHGAKRTASLITFEGGHTGSDTVLYLPQEGILFLSDLLFVNFHPYLAEGDPRSLLNALKELGQLDASCYVPGHGPVGTRQDLELMVTYIDQCLETAHKLMETGTVGEDTINQLLVPEEYQHWKLPEFYRSNIRSICKRLSETDSGISGS